ncbi:MAG: glycosyltransferase family 2 protein [Chitinophagaceae bacterium]|jgi:dolichol-phosphate mannosyltransferase|nr:glycosyltransferase family 2 protein [Chitinophagaceae bacterium]
MNFKPELLIIAPVYNESGILEQFLNDWISNIRLLSIPFELRLYNDGSTDNTAEIIQQLQAVYPELKIYFKTNSGHGPTITAAYEQAVGFNWIFQIDSDHELPVASFNELWKHRNEYDLLVGERIQRHAPVFRVFLTTIVSLSVRILVGKGLRDINAPYRLIRTEKLKEFLKENKKNNFAPNVLMSAFAVKKKWRIKTIPVTHISRKKIKGTGYSMYMLSGAVKTFAELLRFALR